MAIQTKKRAALNPMRLNVALIILILMLVFCMGMNSGTSLNKNETVFVSLNNDGSVKKTEVANWFFSLVKDGELIDYGSYQEIENISGDQKPEIEEYRVIWPATALEVGNFSYIGTTEKELPVNIDIGYFLNGEEIKAENLAGRTGNLEIVFRIKNKLKQDEPISYENYDKNLITEKEDYYTPLAVQISLEANLEKFSDIEVGEGNMVITGKTANISFASIPYPEEEFKLRMKGTDIEIEPINFIIIPQEIPTVMELSESMDELEEFIDGLKEMEEGALDMESGMDELIDGVRELSEGSVELVDGIAEINHGAYMLDSESAEITNGLDEIKDGIEQLNDQSATFTDALSELSSNSSTFNQGIEQLATGTGELGDASENLSGGVELLQSANHNLCQASEAALEDSDLSVLLSADPELYSNVLTVLNGVQGENIIINGDGSSSNPGIYSGIKGLSSGIDNLRQGLVQLADGFGEFSKGINQFYEEVSELPNGVSQLFEGQKLICKGWEDYSNGINELYGGTQELYDNTTGLPDNLNELYDGLNSFREGIEKLKDEGILEIKNEAIKSYNETGKGITLQEELKKLYLDYGSFMDNQNNKNSEVQFVMKTDGVEIKEETKEDVSLAGEDKITLWQRIIMLFKKE